MLIIIVVNTIVRGFGATASLFPDGTLQNTTHTSPGNSVEFNQSDDDFKTPEVFPIVQPVFLNLNKMKIKRLSSHMS